MLTLVARRFVRLLVVLVGVSLVTFAILHVSGDPVALMMPEAPEADRASLRQSMGFNDPLVLERMPVTLLLTVIAMPLSLSLAIPPRHPERGAAQLRRRSRRDVRGLP